MAKNLRLTRFLGFLAPVLGLYWLSCLLVHELGHAAGAWITGGTVTFLDIRPWYLSSTLVAPNPSPRIVVWAGFLLGWLVAAATIPFWSIAGTPALRSGEGPNTGGMPRRTLPIGLLLKGWAAFCWLSMGSYLLVGGGERFSDTGQLLAAGTSWFVIAPIGIAICCTGYRVGSLVLRDIANWLADDRNPTWRQVGTVWLYMLAWWILQHQLANSMPGLVTE